MAEKKYTIIQGDSAQELKHIADNTIDAVITDPPYGIEFLGKSWDSNTGAVEIWQQCLRILKPGGHLLAFSAARTYHHLAMNIETVGFEIRDQLMWIYSSGFPKAQDMGKAIDKRGQKNNWHGWKTALKPGHEPIVMARKRFKGSTIDNIQHYGVGALNIDATRIPFQDARDIKSAQFGQDKDKTFGYINTELQDTRKRENMIVVEANPQGRFPSNVLGDIPTYQKYFYCAKVSRRERHCGHDQDTAHIKNNWEMVKEMGGYYITATGEPIREDGDFGNQIVLPDQGYISTNGLKSIYEDWCKKNGKQDNHGNNHPTVKPVALMRYLIELVTPPNSHIVDPFAGSGTTGMAATELGHTFTGIEQDPAYVTIANKRIKGWSNTQGKPAQPTHIPAPFGSVKGCYDQGERFAVRHQQLQRRTATDKTDPFDRLFE